MPPQSLTLRMKYFRPGSYRVTTTHQRACPDHVNWVRFGRDNQKTRHPPFQSHQKKNRIATKISSRRTDKGLSELLSIM